MVNELTRPAVQQFIREHEQDDVRELVLKTREVEGVPSSIIANQIACRRKAREKLPLWYNTEGIVYPPTINLEQASSEITAQFKYDVLAKKIHPPFTLQAGTAVDLTGGFGVDSFFLSTLFNQFHYVESNAELFEIARHNHRQLGNKNITHHCTTAEEFLQTFPDTINVVYLDPSRRTSGNKKVVRLGDCLPDVTALLPALLEKSPLVLIKTSPLLDIQRGLNELSSVSDVFVVSVANECKEVLFFCRSGFSDEPVIHAVNLLSTDTDFTFSIREEKESAVEFSKPLTYLYEPNASLMKAGAFKCIASRFGLFKLHKNTHLYTSEKACEDFPGRIFRLNSVLGAEQIQKLFPSKRVNILCRNYPLSPDALKKKFNLRDGGTDYLIAATGPAKKYLMAAWRIK
jgi:hypothetical protein